ncbi:ABC transporter permease [Desulfosediminicola sp.]|uniref:ABC transporter permease n=1 Tax=Desulfosediminicola sp. TaxID=2886825 RepID=UPI003AF25B27
MSFSSKLSTFRPLSETGSCLSLLKIAGIAALLFFLIGYILFPILKTLEVSLLKDQTFSVSTYLLLFTNESYRVPVVNSIVLGGLTVLVCGVIGTLLAFFIHFFEFPHKSVVDKLLLLPMLLPGIIIVFSFVQLYGESGLITKTLQFALGLEEPPLNISGLPGILFIHAYTQYVYFYISVSIALKHIDISVIESARSLGASKHRILGTVVFPFLAPALIAASAMTFMTGIGAFTAPSIVGGSFKVLTTQILLAKANNYMDIAATQVVTLIAISLFLFGVFRFYEGRTRFTSSVNVVPIQPVRIRSQGVRLLVLLSAGIVIATILLPVVTIILISFVPSGSWMVSYYPTDFSLQNYADIFSRSRRLAPFLNSVVMALAAGGLGAIIALPCSYIIVRSQIRIKWLVEILTVLPWAVPASAIAINIINAFNEPSLFSFSAVLVGSSVLLPLGYLIKSLPIMIRTINISLGKLNDTYLEVSKSLGANRLQTFTQIILPVLSPGLLAGFLLVFIRSIGEYTMSVFLYNASNKPVSIAMVNGIFEYNIGLAMAYGSLLIVLTVLLVWVIGRFLGTFLRPE